MTARTTSWSSRVAAVLLALVAGGAVGLAQPAPEPTTYPASPAELLARLKPLPAQLKGWTVAPDPQSATGPVAAGLLAPEAAAVVQAYQLDWLLQLQLLPPAPHEPVALEVLRFADPLDAFGAFSAFRTTTSEHTSLKTASYWTGAQYCVWRENFLLRAIPADGGAPARLTAEVAADAALTVMPLPCQMPLMMRLMPDARQVANSLRYYRQNLLGRLPLGDALAADYHENGTQLQLALVRYADDEAARQAYCEVADVLAPGACASPLALLGRQAQVLPTRQFGLAYLVHEGRYLILALNVHDRDTAEGLLRITATNIRIVR